MSRAPKRIQSTMMPNWCEHLWIGNPMGTKRGAHEGIMYLLRRCVSLHRLPLVSHCHGVASCRRHSPFHTTTQPTTSVFCVNASLSVSASATCLKILRESWTAQAPHAHRARQKAYSRRPVQASQPEISSFKKKSKTSTTRFRALIDQFFTHANASPTSTPPCTKTPPE